MELLSSVKDSKNIIQIWLKFSKKKYENGMQI
jgi:hypothetical protein